MEVKKFIKENLVSIIVLIITLIAISIMIGIKVKKDNFEFGFLDNLDHFHGKSDVKDELDNLDELEKEKISEEVISKLNKKYGNNNYEILNIKKGYRSGWDYDVYVDYSYFDIKVHMSNSEIDTNFTVDYINNRDDLLETLKSRYGEDIFKNLWRINSNVNSVIYSLSDYNGNLGHSGKDYMSLDTIYGQIPSQEDVNLLVQDLHIYCNYTGDIKDNKETEIFIDNVKQDVKLLYDNICERYPRIPKGIGATSVEFSFGNGVILRIFPLSKSIRVINESDSFEYNWSDLL